MGSSAAKRTDSTLASEAAAAHIAQGSRVTHRLQPSSRGRPSAVAAERIATFLRDLSRRCGAPDGTIPLAMTRGDIADYLGLTLETVSRKMNALMRLGGIELTARTQVRVPDFDRLDALAAAA